jgi:hypothetical protein
MMIVMSTISYLFADHAPVEFTAEPKRRDTKAVGDRSELEVMGALIRNGYRIALPFGENHRYDLIADDGERMFRVQVKTGRLRNGAIRMTCSSSHFHRRKSGERSNRSYRGQVDFLAVYCPETKKVYLLPESELVESSGHLRIAPTKNRQERNIRWAGRFELA